MCYVPSGIISTKKKILISFSINYFGDKILCVTQEYMIYSKNSPVPLTSRILIIKRKFHDVSRTVLFGSHRLAGK